MCAGKASEEKGVRGSVPGTVDSQMNATKSRTDEDAASANNAPRPDRAPFSRSHPVLWAVLLLLGTAAAQCRDLRANEHPPRVGGTARGQEADAVIMNVAAPPLRRNPSAWSHRILTAVAVLALTALQVRYLHLTTLVLGLWLIGYGYGMGRCLSGPPYRNLLMVGALTAVLGIIPSDSLQPTRSGRQYYRRRV
jgi:hypothetical protein